MTAAAQRDASVSLVVWQDTHHLAAVMAGLAEQTLPFRTVHVTVNEDPDGSVSRRVATIADRAGVCIRLSTQTHNAGFAAPHNAMLEEAFDDPVAAVLVLNPDCRLAPEALAALAAGSGTLEPSLLGPLIELAEGAQLAPTGLIDTAGIRWTRSGRHLDALQGHPLTCAPATPSRVRGVSGACLYVPRDAYEKVRAGSAGDFFDPEFFAYREDAELGVRAGLLGVPSVLIPQARALHARRLRGTDRHVPAATNLLGVRNRLLLSWKLGSFRPGWGPAKVLRDVLVVGAAATVERSSWPGVRQAWALRPAMRAKHRDLRAHISRAR